MPTVANTLKDIQDQFRYHLSGMQHVAAAYCTVQLWPPKLRIWTLLDVRDEETDRALAIAERKLRDSFDKVMFDFSTTHLNGREPMQFIPEGAVLIVARHPAVAAYFSRAVSAA
jgi:hypothetical protein